MNKYRTSILALCVSAACLVGIAGFEGYRSDAYRDVAGVPTIGYGETAGVKIGQKTTPDRALIQLLSSANKHADAVRQCVNVPLYQHEFDAYVSLAYNIGPSAFCKSTLVKELNKGNYESACSHIKDFNGITVSVPKKIIKNGEIVTVVKKEKKVIPGLTKRRQTEYLMCMGSAV